MVESSAQLDQLIFVLYDGIANSVFVGQVLSPLIEQLHRNTHLHVTIVSFEFSPPPQSILDALIIHPRLHIKIESKFRFWGAWALWPCASRLKSFLGKFDRYVLMARGPFAGYICMQARTQMCTQLIIQSRGDAAEEYTFTHPKGIIAKLRSWQYKQLEKTVYANSNQNFIIECVSHALKQFLIDEYHNS